MSLRNIMIAVVLILGIAAVYKMTASKKAVNNPSGEVPVVTTPVSPNMPAAPGTTPKRPGPNDSYDIVRNYVRIMTDLPLPAGYQTPEYITSGNSRDQVYEIFATRYPTFYGFGSTQLLDSIRAHPARYEVMITENKAIRKQFDPHSKY